eukprot:641020-Karenia_brevis.AAC.1
MACHKVLAPPSSNRACCHAFQRFRFHLCHVEGCQHIAIETQNHSSCTCCQKDTKAPTSFACESRLCQSLRPLEIVVCVRSFFC